MAATTTAAGGAASTTNSNAAKPSNAPPVDEENQVSNNPPLDLAQLRFLLTLPDDVYSVADKEATKEKLLAAIKTDNMTPFYNAVADQLGWMKDDTLTAAMRQANETRLQELEAKIKDAEENQGESEIREAYFNKADHLCRIGDKEAAVTAFRVVADKTVGLGQRMDVVFQLIRVGFFWGDLDLVKRNIDKAKTLQEEGGDWDRRNRLKIYEAVYAMIVRDFKKAATLLLDGLATFTSYELCSYNTFILYTVLMATIALDRVTLRKSVVNAPEILAVIDEIPHLGAYLNALYNCNYAVFMQSLAAILDQLKSNVYLAPHARYYSREMRVIAYSQLLESYRSVQLESMAKHFGVGVDFLDQELSRFIAAGRLHCKIDKVGGIVETTRPDGKNAQYQTVIRQGDLLLNRIQKLSRVINLDTR